MTRSERRAGRRTDRLAVGCSLATCRYDVSGCVDAPAPVCGDGKLGGDEQCDGEDRSWRSCVDFGSGIYAGGELHCDQATCKLDLTDCTRCDGSRCGDGVIDPEEECDGDNLGMYTCADHNRLFGTPHCNSICRVDYSDCYGGCTLYKGMIIDCH